jgi:hypothetical protein
MRRNLVAALLLAVPLSAPAAEVVLNDLKAQNATQLTKDELAALLPGAKVVSDYRGSTRRWKNDADGKFTANSDGRREATKIGKQITGHGTWHIGDNGTYCVMIEWPQRTENWCKYVFKAGDRYYGVKSLTDGAAEANAFTFTP